jgi:fructose-bisphosphate aldolase, class I
LETAVRINVKIQSVLFKAMLDHGVYMEGALLKSNMVNPGKKCKTSYTVDEIAEANLEVFRRCFPTAMRSANYLSGGQSLEDASARLDAINKRKTSRDPWNLSFSWSAAIQMPLFDLCKGKTELPLQEMEKLYLKELEIASKSALGKHKRNGTEGDHVGK